MPLPVHLDNETKLAKFAREIAMNIRNFDELLTDYEITREDYEEVEKIEFFRRIRDQFVIEWNSSASSEQRTRLIALHYAEQALPVIGQRAADRNEALPAAVDAAKFLTRTAGLTDAAGGSIPSQERFVITINLGADVEKFNKSIAVNPDDVNLADLDQLVLPASQE